MSSINSIGNPREPQSIAQRVGKQLDQERGARQDALANRVVRREYGNDQRPPAVTGVDGRGTLAPGASSYDETMREQERERRRGEARKVYEAMAASEGARISGGGLALPRPLFADPDRDKFELAGSLRSLRALAVLAARQRAAKKGRDVTPRDLQQSADKVLRTAVQQSPELAAALRADMAAKKAAADASRPAKLRPDPELLRRAKLDRRAEKLRKAKRVAKSTEAATQAQLDRLAALSRAAAMEMGRLGGW